MTQIPMFISTQSGEQLPVPTLPLARNSDPATSKAAADSLRGSKALGQAQLTALCLVRAYPGSTANTLARLAGDGDPRKINRRLRELQRAELIKDEGEVADSITHKRCLRWWPK